MANVIIFLCTILTGIVGSYFYWKNIGYVNFKIFGWFCVLGGISSMLTLAFLVQYGVYVTLGLGAIAILFAVKGNKETDAEARQKQYNMAGIFLFVALLVFFLTFTIGNNKNDENKPPVHQTNTIPKPKPKPQEREEPEFNNAETKPQEQTVTDTKREVYVGSYNDGTKVYVLTDTIKFNGGNFTCTVRAGQDQLHYRFDGQNYSSSEGYHGNIHDGNSPVELAIYNYCMNGNHAATNDVTWVIKLNGENVYVKNGSVVRIGDTHPDAAPEFQCVIVVGDSGEQINCEFKARGMVVMFVEGQRFGDSGSDPNIEVLYNAIVKKFLRP